MENIRFLSEEEMLMVAGGLIDPTEIFITAPPPPQLPQYSTSYPSVSASYSGVYSPGGGTSVAVPVTTSTYGDHSSTPKSF